MNKLTVFVHFSYNILLMLSYYSIFCVYLMNILITYINVLFDIERFSYIRI